MKSVICRGTNRFLAFTHLAGYGFNGGGMVSNRQTLSYGCYSRKHDGAGFSFIVFRQFAALAPGDQTSGFIAFAEAKA